MSVVFEQGASAIVAVVRMLPVRLMLLGLVWVMTPGLTEATENLWHLARAGHTAHAHDAGADHAPSGVEHGCSGTFHLCSCHHSSPTTLHVVGGTHELSAAGRCRELGDGLCQSPHSPGLFRPPRA